MKSNDAGEMSIFDRPAYRALEAARILGLPAATVTAWCFGQRYRGSAGEDKQFRPVVKAADRRNRLLSFANLCELHVLSAIRRHHRVTLPKVRRSLDYVRDKLASPRPLLDTQFQTNGIDLFVAHASQLLNVSKQGQQALRGEFERALARIERDANGAPIRLFPFTRSHGAEGAAVIVVDPRLSFGRPLLMHAGVKTDVIRSRFNAGDSIGEMARDYRVEPAAIEEALRFEQRLAA
jgi:uncharacterized protein (DUF433 family)